MRANALIPVVVLLLPAWACAAGGRAEAAPYPVNEAFAADTLFADGKAEVDVYDATVTRERAPRNTVAYMILVAEDLDPQKLVKADDWRRPGLLRTMKYELQLATRTGMMEYHEALNLWLSSPGWEPVKLVYSHQDWCGITQKLILNHGDRKTFRYTSYWDEDGSLGDLPSPLTGRTVPADALPAWLRGLDLRDGLRFDLEVLPSLAGGKVGKPEPVEGTVSVSGPAGETVPAGTFRSWEVKVEYGGKSETFRLEQAFPHRVVSWTDAAGQTFRLAKSLRAAYWTLSQPGDEKALQP